MAKPLRSDDPAPRNVQFSHFGVLDDGSRSKTAVVTSVITNLIVVSLLIVVGSIVKNAIVPPKEKTITFVQPIEKPPVIKPPPPPPPVKLPPPPRPPLIKQPEPIKPPPELKPIPVPVVKPFVPAPAPPKRINPPPAPVKVNMPTMAAAVPNHDAHPTAVRLGATDNPLKPLTGPAVSNVNLGVRGVPGMSAANSGNGPHATSVQLGNGCPNCTNMNGTDRGNSRVVGVKLGVPGGTGPMNSTNYGNRPVQVQLQTQAPPPSSHPTVQSTIAASAPTVISKPTPVYTAEARALHLEGSVSVRVKVEANGVVEVLGLVPGRGLGHGLDQSALQAAQGTRFKPALDASGHPVPWEGVILVRFQTLS